MKEALIIFAKPPIAGKVKTRLSSTIGDEMALQIYEVLLNHTRNITKSLSIHKFLYWKSNSFNYSWEGYISEVQRGQDLGEKMKNAFDSLFKKGYQKIVIIGSDCIDLQEHHLNEAFTQLNSNDICIGPAKDGGYYLLGMNVPFPQLFYNILWSSNSVLNETVRICNIHQRTIHMLPVLSDIDREEDLTPELKLLLEST